MAFPTIPTTGANTLLSTTTSTASTTHTFPSLTTLAPAAGDLIIAICVQYQGGTANAEFSAWGASLIEFLDDALGSGTGNGANGFAYKVATGSESGTFTVTSAHSFKSVNILMRIPTGTWHGTTAPAVTASNRASGVAADPASLSPSWGADDTLWISVFGHTETTTTGSPPTISNSPTNYSGDLIVARAADAVGDITAGVGFRQLNAASEDAGVYTGTNLTHGSGIAAVIAVRPLPPPVTKTQSATARISVTGLTATQPATANVERIALATADLGHVSSGTGSATSINVNTNKAVPTGGFILLATTCYTSTTGAIPTPSGGGLTWTLDAQCDVGSTPGATILYLFRAPCPSGLSSGTTITVNYDRAAFIEFTMSSWTASGTVFVDASVATPQATGRPWTSGNLTIGDPYSVIVGVATEILVTTDAANPDQAAVSSMSGASVGTLAVSQLTPGVTGTYAMTGTWATDPTAHAAVIAVAYKVASIVTKTQSAIANIASGGSVLTKTQSATARISNTLTKTQSALARISITGLTKTQSSVARISKTFTFTQGAIARISNASMTKTQSSIARISNTGMSKTQSAVARISKSFTFTQSAVARISKSFTKTQGAIARIQITTTKTQSALARVSVVGLTKTQSATARISKIVTKTQSAIANISGSSQVSKTQTAIARIQVVGIAKTQSAIARVQVTGTKTQSAIARVSNTGMTKTQSAIARISNTGMTKTQSAVARIQKSFTKTQTAVARIAIVGTKTQSAIARVQIITTKTQSAVARVSNTGMTKTQGAIARVQVTGLTKTQSSVARIQKTITKTQSATANIIAAGVVTKTQNATARIQRTGLTLTQSAVARIAITGTKTQSAIARVSNAGMTKTQAATARITRVGLTFTQSATARISKTLTKTQAAIARVQISTTKTQGAIARIQQTGLAKTQPAVARIQKSFTKTQTAVARVSRALTSQQLATARIRNAVSRAQPAVARIAKSFTRTQSAVASIVRITITIVSGFGTRPRSPSYRDPDGGDNLNDSPGDTGYDNDPQGGNFD